MDIGLIGFMAVEGFSEKASGSSFPNSSRSRKKIRVVKPVELNSVLERRGNGFLASYLVESLWTPFSGYDRIRQLSDNLQ
jgi:hypothetical protein